MTSMLRKAFIGLAVMALILLFTFPIWRKLTWDPDAASRLCIEGRRAFSEQRYSEAFQLLSGSLDAMPTYDAFVLRGMTQIQLGRIWDSHSDFNRALKLDATKALPHYCNGYATLRLGAADQALPQLTAALTCDDSAESHLQFLIRRARGNAHFRLGSWEAAADDFSIALRICPGDTYILERRSYMQAPKPAPDTTYVELSTKAPDSLL